MAASGCVEADASVVAACRADREAPVVLEPTDEVDLLLTIDNSNSMGQEQALLRVEIPRLISALLSGDRDWDSLPDSIPARSLHVGVITTDLGAGDVPPGAVVPSCDPGLGDDGILRSVSRGRPGCPPTYPSRVFRFEAGDDEAVFTGDVACVADLMTGGCGFEQQLEATLKALSPAGPQPYVSSTYEPPTFFGGVGGHGDGANAGFLREGSVLLILVLSDEEDCSVPGYEIFYPDDPTYMGHPLNLRCHQFPYALHPIERYVAGLLQLRESPRQLVYAPLVGIPLDLAGEDYDEMLRDSRMRSLTGVYPDQSTVPSCDGVNGIAFAPRRIVEVARGLSDAGALTTVQSICAADFGSAIDAILEQVDIALRGGPVVPSPVCPPDEAT